jgi:competence protein ComEA
MASHEGATKSAQVKPRVPTPLNINTANAEALQALPGIGPLLADRIVADREAHGPFRTPEDLLRVPGIGPKRWERIRPLVRLAEEP